MLSGRYAQASNGPWSLSTSASTAGAAIANLGHASGRRYFEFDVISVQCPSVWLPQQCVKAWGIGVTASSPSTFGETSSTWFRFYNGERDVQEKAYRSDEYADSVDADYGAADGNTIENGHTVGIALDIAANTMHVIAKKGASAACEDYGDLIAAFASSSYAVPAFSGPAASLDGNTWYPYLQDGTSQTNDATFEFRGTPHCMPSGFTYWTA